MSDDKTFGAFEAFISEIGSPSSTSKLGGRDFPLMDPSEIGDEDNIPGEENSDEEVNIKEDQLELKDEFNEPEVEVKEEEEVVTEPEVDESKNKSEDDVVDLGEYESDITKIVQTKLYEKFGWDIKEDEMFDKIDGIVDHLEEIIEINSKPKFASNELEELNKYVENGGDLKTYFQNSYGEFDIDNMDISRESHQELVVREQLKELGLSKEAINKRINRYSETGILEDEAAEAFDYLKNTKEEKRKKLLDNQNKVREDLIKQQQEFYKNVSSTIENKEDIKGVKLSKADKLKLIDYIFNPGSDGKTQYQKDYAKNFNNLIESAFFTMKGDLLVQSIQKQASSQAVKTLKEKLKTKTKLGKDSSESFTKEDNTNTMLSTFSRYLRPS